jgi:hypothetical protein
MAVSVQYLVHEAVASTAAEQHISRATAADCTALGAADCLRYGFLKLPQ